MRGTGDEAGGCVMTTFDPDQALAAYIELYDKQARSQLTSVLISSGVWSAGIMILWLLLTIPFVNLE